MKRLTKWFGEGANRVAGVADDLEEKYTPEEIIDMLLAALAPYEDTGLEPGDVIDLITEYRALGLIDHLRELVQAEQDGRLVVLPCKVGDTVVCVLTTRDCPPVIFSKKIQTIEQAAGMVGKVGKHLLLSYYLTREEAEAALEAQE